MAADPKLVKLIIEALDLGLGCFQDGDHDPFIMFHDGKKNHLIDLQSTDGMIGEGLLNAGREIIKTFADTGKRYVLVWDGYITTDGVKNDAVFAEAGTSGQPNAHVLAQRYKILKSGKFSKMGRPALAADVANLWNSHKKPKPKKKASEKTSRKGVSK